MNSSTSAFQEASFNGGAFHPSLSKGKSSGILTLSAEGIGFTADSGGTRMPLSGLEISIGGANDAMVFFKHEACPEWTIYTGDASILKHPLLANQAELRDSLRHLKRKRRLSLAIVLGLILIFAGGLSSLFLFKDTITLFLANRIPVEWEVKLGETLFQQIEKKERLLADSQVEASLETLTQPLVQGIHDLAYPLRFHIVENPAINAFAMPGGNVVIHTGLILAAETPEEIAGVLAHEIAHVTHRHGFRNIIGSAGLFLIVQMLIGDVGGIIAVVADNSAFLLNRKFSRDFEREADDQGWVYLIQAGIHPKGMVDFFRTLHREEVKAAEKGGLNALGSSLDFLSTHPGTEERIDRLEAKMESMPSMPSHVTFQLNLEAFKNSIRASLHRHETDPQ